MRHVTEITEENVVQCQELILLGIEMRHLSGVVGGFAINDTEFDAKTSTDANVNAESIYSNNSAIVEQNRSVLNALWNIALPASQRIKEIEEKRMLVGQINYQSNHELQLVNHVATDVPEEELGAGVADSFIVFRSRLENLVYQQVKFDKLSNKKQRLSKSS